MFAVVELGGRQFIVKENDVLEVNKIEGVKENGTLEIDKVLCLFKEDGSKLEVGTPYIKGKKIKVKIVNPLYKDKKLVGAKFKQRKRYLRMFGHRQHLTKLQVGKVA